MNQHYFVSKQGNDRNEGSESAPFLTIQKAAEVATAGDTVTVRKGTYREWVSPCHSGESFLKPIVFQAAKGEKVHIKGSEVVKHWQHLEGSVYFREIDNAHFGDYNPYAEVLEGDWFIYPKATDWQLHTGDVYLNGTSLFEAKSLEEVQNPQRRETFRSPIQKNPEKIHDPDSTLYQWYAIVEEKLTTIYANFQEYDPNKECVEIHLRKCCFFPKKIKRNYITVRGFEMSQAACPYTPPTADQPAMLGVNWGKGWVIEDNILHDAKCSAVSLGKEESTGHNFCTRFQEKSGYQNQMEAVFRALQLGWNKDNIGSHVVRNNHIYNCGQNAIVGHMGCAFSEIYGNHIHHIGTKHEFFAWEIAGIKFHAPIDTYIHHNYIHHCTLGLWMDWQTQGTRISGNVLNHCDRDCTLEVSHGPFLLDHNIFNSDYNFDNMAQGGAYVHNIFTGVMKKGKVLDRSTPYHYPHSTAVAGCALVYGNDDRYYNNLFLGREENPFFGSTPSFFGTSGYDNAPISMEEYQENYREGDYGDEEKFSLLEQPVYIDGNAYFRQAKGFHREEKHCILPNYDPNFVLTEEEDGVYVKLNLPECFFQVETKQIHSALLGTVRLVQATYDNPDGSPLFLNTDLLGQSHGICPQIGALEGLVVGYNKIKLFSFTEQNAVVSCCQS